MNKASEEWLSIGSAQFETVQNVTARRRPFCPTNVLLLVLCCCLNLLVSAQQDPTAALCQQQTDTLSSILNYPALYGTVVPNCAQSGNDLSCIEDFSVASASVEAACTKEGGKIYTTSEDIACNYMQGKVSVSLKDIGLCVGTNCSTSYLDALFQQGATAADSILSQAVSNASQSLSAQGLTNCAVSFSSSTRVFVLMTGIVTVAVSLLGHLVVDFMA